MAFLGNLQHPFTSHEEPAAIAAGIKKLGSFSNPLLHQQFADISKGSPNRLPWVDLPLHYRKIRSSQSTAALLSIYRENARFYRSCGETSFSMWLNRRSLYAQSPSREKKGMLSVSATSMPYRESVDEGWLGGFCMGSKDMQIVSGAASTIIFAVANKVLYKMALVPLKEYPFFLALINTFGYVLVYFSVLYIRYQAGIVTDEMLKIPKTHFVLAGALEALGLASGMAAAANLPGTSISILLQTFLVWQLVLSMVFLKKRFSFGQMMSCTIILCGVAIALCGSTNGFELSANQTGVFWPLLMIFSCAFQASSTVVKEFVFQDASKHLKGGSVDIFVVNSFGSAFQAIFVIFMLPFLSQLRGVPFNQLGSYMTKGAGCLFNIGSMSTECSGATLLTFSYIVVNLVFNISLLSLLKMSSAVVSSLCSTLAVPLAIYAFTLPLPYLGATASLQPQFLIGTMILLSGLFFYNACGCLKKPSRSK